MTGRTTWQRLKAIALNCTLKRSGGESSSTDKMIDLLAERAREARGRTDRNHPHGRSSTSCPGVKSDEGEGDDWPAIRKKILDADILIFGTPVWMGQMSSIAKRVHRADGRLPERNRRCTAARRLTARSRSAAIVGNEDGAHHITATVFQALNDVGWTIPAAGACYWVGEAMHKVDFKDLQDGAQGRSARPPRCWRRMPRILLLCSRRSPIPGCKDEQVNRRRRLPPTFDRDAPTLAERLRATRALTLDLAAPLSDADAAIQPFPDASPAKWHLAHTSWFFETFVLRDHVAGYRPFDERFAFLFNSYYEGEGERHARPRRGMISRPVARRGPRLSRACRRGARARACPSLRRQALELVELGINHEQQHQELFLTDILATFAENPLEPAYGELADRRLPRGRAADLPSRPRRASSRSARPATASPSIANARATARLLHPHAIASRRVTNGEWREFIADGGYSNPDAVAVAKAGTGSSAKASRAPLYWRDDGDRVHAWPAAAPIDWAAPVAHVSYFEADAFARWAGARLPTEAEWEDFAASADPHLGNQLDRAGAVAPRPAAACSATAGNGPKAPSLPTPASCPAEGTVGEYNGKFMCGQFVLKGASCATPRGHSRASYRNFFPPAARWQFTGVRLARDA